MKLLNSIHWQQLLTPGNNNGPVDLNCNIDMSRFFLSSFSKTENMEKARLPLIEKLKEALAAPPVTVIQCSRVDNGREKKQTVPQVC